MINKTLLIFSLIIFLSSLCLFGLLLFNFMQFEIKETSPENVVREYLKKESVSKNFNSWIENLILQKIYFKENRNNIRDTNIKFLLPVFSVFFILGLVGFFISIKTKNNY